MFKRRNGKPYKLFILAQIIYWLAQQKEQFMKHFLNGLRLNIGVKVSFPPAIKVMLRETICNGDSAKQGSNIGTLLQPFATM